MISHTASLYFSLAMPANCAVPPPIALAGRGGFSLVLCNSLVAFFRRGDVVFRSFPPRLPAVRSDSGDVRPQLGQPEFRLRRRLEEQLEDGKTVTNARALPNRSRLRDIRRL